mmetsp:Transcript_20922/g.51560  ORF Transcript_20922/g.51560 Transcript_20922/m.51560 type:complete len:223 (+) Transcript_20922:326-994(+)
MNIFRTKVTPHSSKPLPEVILLHPPEARKQDSPPVLAPGRSSRGLKPSKPGSSGESAPSKPTKVRTLKLSKLSINSLDSHLGGAGEVGPDSARSPVRGRSDKKKSPVELLRSTRAFERMSARHTRHGSTKEPVSSFYLDANCEVSPGSPRVFRDASQNLNRLIGAVSPRQKKNQRFPVYDNREFEVDTRRNELVDTNRSQSAHEMVREPRHHLDHVREPRML